MQTKETKEKTYKDLWNKIEETKFFLQKGNK